MPEIIKEFPDFTLKIAGKNMSKWFYNKQDKNIIVDGEVEDALSYQADKQIMIVPLLSGSGIRVKIIEAMALGKVVISTSSGAAGIPFCNNTNILIADTKDEFIRHVRKCMESEDFCKVISLNAQKLAKESFDLEYNSNKIMNYYYYITGL
jgi:glycosyltransferase involved in cell wall biosynthesis